jgi:hypothetical protein
MKPPDSMIERPFTKTLVILLATEAVVLSIAVGVFLHSLNHQSFPPSVPVVQTPQGTGGRAGAVPVTVIGVTTTAALERGGQAGAMPFGRDTGYVGYRRIAAVSKPA